MNVAQELDIPVVPESFIAACETGNPIDKIKELSICSWGGNVSNFTLSIPKIGWFY